MEREKQVEPLKIAKTSLVAENMENCPSQCWSGAWLCLYPRQKEKKKSWNFLQWPVAKPNLVQ